MLCLTCGSPAIPGRMFCEECGHPLPVRPPSDAVRNLAPGEQIHGYTVIAPVDDLNRQLYRARAADGAPVWLKEGSARTLDAEAAALTAMTSAAVARVVDRFAEGGREYLVTAAAPDAVPLERAGSYDADRALDLALQLCSVAEAWHQAGYIYGDFSPRTVFYQPAAGRIWLPGAASAVRIGSGDLADPTADGAAPEVVAGAPPGPAADVYGVASTVYRVLALGARATLPLGQTGQLLPPLQTIRPDLPPDFCAALGQALSREASERFQTPAALAGALIAVCAPFRLEAGACTDRGSVRASNQDCLYTAVLGMGGGDRERATGGIFVCCDGMGGEAGGEIASGLTVETVGGALAAFLGARLTRGPVPDAAELESALRGALTRANKLLRDKVRETPALHGMGTTITALAISGNAAAIIHVGDSRCYLWEPGGALRQVTRDQSVVSQMVAAGEITAEEARLRPDRTLLYQAVGSREVLEPELIHLNLRPGQRLLLATDGVHGFLSDDQLAELLARPIPPGAAANMIVNSAIEQGSDDNCSAVVVAIQGRAG